jgi:hypothetical protein
MKKHSSGSKASEVKDLTDLEPVAKQQSVSRPAEPLEKLPSESDRKPRNFDDSYQPRVTADNLDCQSSVSFNTGVLNDQFDNMDSISQVMGASEQDSGSGAIDLKNVGAEISKRDKRIQELSADRSKLKGLLKKAKGVLDSLNEKHRASQDKNRQLDGSLKGALDKNKDLL